MATKKKYEKPAVQVFELKQQPQLLAGSTGTGELPGMPIQPI
jgi:hypothetical protein